MDVQRVRRTKEGDQLIQIIVEQKVSIAKDLIANCYQNLRLLNEIVHVRDINAITTAEEGENAVDKYLLKVSNKLKGTVISMRPAYGRSPSHSLLLNGEDTEVIICTGIIKVG